MSYPPRRPGEDRTGGSKFEQNFDRFHHKLGISSSRSRVKTVFPLARVVRLCSTPPPPAPLTPPPRPHTPRPPRRGARPSPPPPIDTPPTELKIVFSPYFTAVYRLHRVQKVLLLFPPNFLLERPSRTFTSIRPLLFWPHPSIRFVGYFFLVLTWALSLRLLS